MKHINPILIPASLNSVDLKRSKTNILKSEFITDASCECLSVDIDEYNGAGVDTEVDVGVHINKENKTMYCDGSYFFGFACYLADFDSTNSISCTC